MECGTRNLRCPRLASSIIHNDLFFLRTKKTPAISVGLVVNHSDFDCQRSRKCNVIVPTPSLHTKNKITARIRARSLQPLLSTYRSVPKCFVVSLQISVTEGSIHTSERWYAARAPACATTSTVPRRRRGRGSRGKPQNVASKK